MPSFSLVHNEPLLNDRFGTSVTAGAMWRRIGAAMRREPFRLPVLSRSTIELSPFGNSAAATSVSSRRWRIAGR